MTPIIKPSEDIVGEESYRQCLHEHRRTIPRRNAGGRVQRHRTTPHGQGTAFGDDVCSLSEAPRWLADFSGLLRSYGSYSVVLGGGLHPSPQPAETRGGAPALSSLSSGSAGSGRDLGAWHGPVTSSMND